MNEQPLAQDDILSVESAKKLIEFIFNTNYGIAAHGDGLFDNKEEALAFVESDEYLPDEPLHVVWDTKQGNYCDSVMATFDEENQLWVMDDPQMGGATASGDTIEEALANIRKQFDPEEDFCPVELIIKS